MCKTFLPFRKMLARLSFQQRPKEKEGVKESPKLSNRKIQHQTVTKLMLSFLSLFGQSLTPYIFLSCFRSSHYKNYNNRFSLSWWTIQRERERQLMRMWYKFMSGAASKWRQKNFSFSESTNDIYLPYHTIQQQRMSYV